jgi:hypothetical protein
MSTQTIHYLIAGALFVHGVGHSLGFWMPARCWLFPSANPRGMRILSSIFWVAAAVGFVASSLAFLGILLPFAWWSALAVVSELISLLGLVLFLGNWPKFNTAGALGMNFLVLVTQLWPGWLAG